jgi:hypothetical protein
VIHAPLYDPEEPRIIFLIEMIAVPQSGLPDSLSATIVAQPPHRRRIKRRFFVITQKGNGIALDETSLTLWTRFTVDRKPQKRHIADVLTDCSLQRVFASEDRLPCQAKQPPSGSGIILDPPRIGVRSAHHAS